jgi:probable rRNA maturation factor
MAGRVVIRQTPFAGVFKETETMISIEIANQQEVMDVDEERLREAVAAILREERIKNAEISLALVDDRAMRELNKKYLRHDYATDVLSFVLQRSPQRLEGQVVAGAETAVAQSRRYGWQPDDELLLYVIHGVLHLLGLDDAAPQEREEMRRREASCLGRFGLQPHWEEIEE